MNRITNPGTIGPNELNHVNGGYIFYNETENGYTCAVYDEKDDFELLRQFTGTDLKKVNKRAAKYADKHNVSGITLPNSHAGDQDIKFGECNAEALRAVTADSKKIFV